MKQMELKLVQEDPALVGTVVGTWCIFASASSSSALLSLFTTISVTSISSVLTVTISVRSTSFVLIVVCKVSVDSRLAATVVTSVKEI